MAIPTFGAQAEGATYEPPKAFRGIKFGSSASDYPDLVLAVPARAGGYTSVYKRKGEDLTIGEAEITDVSYFFDKDNGLVIVFVEFQSAFNWAYIKDVVHKKYGEGVNSTKGDMSLWVWGEESKVSIQLQYWKDSSSGRLSYFYNPPQDKRASVVPSKGQLKRAMDQI